MDNIVEKLRVIIDEIPPLSNTTSQLLEQIGNPNHSLQDIVKIVNQDAVLTGLVLKTVNSSYYGLSKTIESVDDAIKYLGDSAVAGLALKSEKSDIYNKDMSGYKAAIDAAWAHSLKVGIASRYLAKRFSGGDVRESVAYTAGIVHDIGKSLISGFLNENEQQILDDEFIEYERNNIGITHAEAGSILADKWKLPDIIKEVIEYHHEPNLATQGYRKIVYIVHLADFIAMMSGSGTGIDSMRYSIDENYSKYLPISDEELEKTFFEIQLEFKTTFNAINSTFESEKKE